MACDRPGFERTCGTLRCFSVLACEGTTTLQAFTTEFRTYGYLLPGIGKMADCQRANVSFGPREARFCATSKDFVRYTRRLAVANLPKCVFLIQCGWERFLKIQPLTSLSLNSVNFCLS